MSSPEKLIEISKAMMVLGETFNEPVSAIRIEAYYAALSDLDTTAVLAAMHHCMRSSKFFPRPAEIREMVAGDTESKADGAWGEVLHAIRTVGYMRFPLFDDQRIMPAIRDVWGSWERLCTTLPAEGPELVGWIKQFKSAYRSSTLRMEQAQLMAGMSKAIGETLKQIAATKGMQ